LSADPEHTSYLPAVAWIDQKHARFVLHPGSQEPGGGGWSQPDHLPVEQRPGLIAAWNGAFRITNGDAKGGFYLDGRTVAGLRDGQASEVIKRDGSIAIGQWGRDVTMTPDVVGVRQNLVLLVGNGQVVPAVDSSDHNLWGVTVDNRQLAVLILRDVLGFHANEVADMLDTTVESVKSALKRARAGMQRRLPVTTAREQPPASGSPAEDAIVAKFVSAYESADIDALVALLTDDVFMSMPPMPLEYQGRDSVARFCAFIFGSVQRFELVPTRANGQPAFGVYRHTPAGIHGVGLFVLTLAGDRIGAMTRFENTVLPVFGLPQSLPSAQ
jgi:SnoaL-like domain